MSKIIVEKECGCFKRSDFENHKEYESKEQALTEALAMAEDMNETFCQKHNFQVVEQGDDVVIKMEMN